MMKAGKSKPKVPYHRKPGDLTLDAWQAALRKQFAEIKPLKIKNSGSHDVFSDYSVLNPENGNTYKVAIRSAEPGINFCTCLDFKTNALGTCKHIEAVLLKIQKKSQTKKTLHQGFEPHYTSVYLKYGETRQVKIRIGTEQQKKFKELAKKHFDVEGTLIPSAFFSIDTFLRAAHQLHPDFRCYEDALQFIIDYREKIRRHDLTEKFFNSKNSFDKIINAKLFPYQEEGIKFAVKTGRSLIADDMGLGKTIQAIGAAEAMKKLFDISKVLIVCPTSLKYQWKSEIEKFTSSSLTVIEGQNQIREKQLIEKSFYKICSYNVVGRDLEKINVADFDLVILDEAQRIKNWQTNIAKSVKKIHSKYMIVLTGTPLENKLEELYSIVQVIDPLKLGALYRFVNQHQVIDEASGKITGYKELNKIGEHLKDILLRRHKRDVLKQLPKRMDKNIFVSMTEKQLDYYNEAKEAVSKLVNKWARFKFLNEIDRQFLLINLNRMRMACNSTFIIDQETRHDTKIDELMDILEAVFSNDNEKVVVFSQWERMTRIVAQELDARKIGYESLHGGVPSKQREQLFKNFNNDLSCKVFLSTDAGGVGLNLQAASVLVNLDLPWNPAVLEQRIGRIHRMGQKKNVQIINLISANTIEEEMLGKLKFKSSMAMGVLDNGEDTVFLGESKFAQLMKDVQTLTESGHEKPMALSEETKKEKEDAARTFGVTENKTDDEQRNLFDTKPETTVRVTANKKIEKNTPTHVHELLESSAGFLEKLFATLADKEKTEELVNTLVKQDESTGQSYLQIPLQNKESLAKGLAVLSQLFGGVKI